MNSELTFSNVIVQGIKIGLVNFFSIIAAIILWVLTIWIPYLNVGTTIAIATMPIGMSKGVIMSPLEIFKGKYRQYMGEYFLLIGLKAQGLLPALMFMVVPFIILSLTWSQAAYLLIDKGINPAESLSKSNKITYGHKATMFFGKLVMNIAILLLPFIIAWATGGGVVASIILFIFTLILIPANMGANAFIYKCIGNDEIVA